MRCRVGVAAKLGEKLLPHILHGVVFRSRSRDDFGLLSIRVKVGVDGINYGEFPGGRIRTDAISGVHAFQLIEDGVADAEEINSRVSVMAPPVMRFLDEHAFEAVEVVPSRPQIRDVHV